ncbi:MAG: DUF1559 domain-containing protein [Planctomycetaceae bacterium]|nr:DUF1559 domain-containing protein [Planctomycetaceae bacterium]
MERENGMTRLGEANPLAPRTSSFDNHWRKWAGFLGCCLLIVTALAVRRFISTRNAERDALARGRLAQIALALNNYHQDYGRFPPAVVYDENGTPMHSWRALISPYLDVNSDGKYDFGESWNSPANAPLRNASVQCFSSQSDDEEVRGSTNFVAVVGPGTVWDEKRASSGRAVTTSIMVVELKKSGINWLEPRDISTRP